MGACRHVERGIGIRIRLGDIFIEQTKSKIFPAFITIAHLGIAEYGHIRAGKP